MKNGIKRTALLVLSCASLVATVGYSSWIIESNKNYSLNNRDTVSKPVAYIVGNEKVKYTTIERALDVAQSGDIVMLIPPTDNNYHSANNKITPNKATYKITRDCTIKEGVSLVIPTDAESASSVKDANSLGTYISSMSNDDRNRGGNFTQSAQSDSTHYLRVTMQINDGVTLTNKGSLIISGYLSGGLSNGGSIGRTSHSYSQITLGKNSKILQDSNTAKTCCFGFITEANTDNGSNIDIAKGKVYVPLVIYDYRGFTFSVALTGGALSSQHCSPFNQFGLENVQATMNVSYAASVIGISNLYVKYDSSFANVDQNFYNEVTFVGNDSSAFVQLTDSNFSEFSLKYSASTKKAKVTIQGGMMLNNINLSLKATSSMSISFSTVDSFLPITGMFDITFSKAAGQTDSASFNLSKQRVKVLPGSKVHVQSGCSVTSNDVIVYSAFYDGTLGNGPAAVNGYNSYKYPFAKAGQLIVENGSTISASSFGGVAYCDNESSIKATSTTVISKEAWNVKSSGKLNPPWTIDDFLEIHEEKTVVPLSYLSRKKVYCGVNIFTENNSNIPSYDVVFDDGINVNVREFQKVIFLDDETPYHLSFNSNIYNAFYEDGHYKMGDSVAAYSEGGSVIGAVASEVSISANNGGINEFEVRSVTVSCSTPLVDGEVPLYVDSAVQLRANVVDAEKAYDKTIVWSSSDSSIASVDQTGKVTGKKLGDVVISATCGGVTGTFSTKVIPSKETTPIASITITDSKKDTATMDVSAGSSQSFESFNSKNKYGNNQSIDFTLSLNQGAQWAGIEWTLNASAAGRQYLNDSSSSVNTVRDTEKVTLHTGSGTGASDDAFKLTVKVTELGSGKTYTMALTLTHKADVVCIVCGTLIRMADGREKLVQDLMGDDSVLAFDHVKGGCVPERLFFNYHQNENNVVTGPVLGLSFENGKTVGVYADHGFFDYTRMRYVYINKENFENFIGDDFVCVNNNGKLGMTRLVSGTIQTKTVKVYSPVSEYQLNIFTNSLLSITGEIEGWFNYFDYDDRLRYDEEALKRDIEKYGLYGYEDFKEYIRKEIFDLLPIPYLKISVGKGLTTKAKIIEVMKKYLSFM